MSGLPAPTTDWWAESIHLRNRINELEKRIDALTNSDALIEQEQGDYVELAEHVRISRNGDIPQYRPKRGDPWLNYGSNGEVNGLVIGYRKGRETGDQDGYARGLAEGRKETEALRDKVMKVQVISGYDFRTESELSAGVVMRYEDYSRICALARSMK